MLIKRVPIKTIHLNNNVCMTVRFWILALLRGGDCLVFLNVTHGRGMVIYIDDSVTENVRTC